MKAMSDQQSLLETAAREDAVAETRNLNGGSTG